MTRASSAQTRITSFLRSLMETAHPEPQEPWPSPPPTPLEPRPPLITRQVITFTKSYRLVWSPSKLGICIYSAPHPQPLQGVGCRACELQGQVHTETMLYGCLYHICHMPYGCGQLRVSSHVLRLRPIKLHDRAQSDTYRGNGCDRTASSPSGAMADLPAVSHISSSDFSPYETGIGDSSSYWNGGRLSISLLTSGLLLQTKSGLS